MRALAGLGAALALAGCAGGAGGGPDPRPAVALECLEAGRLAEGGEHKPAVDALASARGAGIVCGAPVLEAVAASERALGRADDLVRQSLEAKRAGNLAEAQRSLRQALAVYPKYYWAEKLLRDLQAASSAEEPALLQEAVGLLASGRPREALTALDKAARLAPEDSLEVRRLRTEIADLGVAQAQRAQQEGDLDGAAELAITAAAAEPEPPVRARVVEFARRLGLNLFSAGELLQAQAIWRAALALDAADELLQQYLDEVAARLRSLDQIRKGG